MGITQIVIGPPQNIQRPARHAQNIISPDRRRIKEMPGNCIVCACQHQNPGKPFCHRTGIFTARINDFEDFLQRCHTQQPLPRFRNEKSPLFVTKWNFVTKQNGYHSRSLGRRVRGPITVHRIQNFSVNRVFRGGFFLIKFFCFGCNCRFHFFRQFIDFTPGFFEFINRLN